MPVEYEYHDNRQGVLIRAWGNVDGSDMISSMRRIFSDDETIRNYRYGIVDYSNIATFNISHDQIFSLAKIHIEASKINPHIIVGFAIEKPLVYGLVRIWMVYANMTGWKVNIEKDLESITRWVKENLPAP